MVWAAIGGAAVSVVGGALLSKKSKSSSSSGSSGSGGFAGLLSDYMTAKQGQEMASARDKAVAMADPFAQSRQLANTQLQSLMQNPGQMQNDPSYQWAVQQGGQAVDRSLAAKHMTASGGALQELSQWGQGLASQQYNQRLNQLSMMASQGASPSAAANAELQGTQYSQGLMSAAAAGGINTMASGGGIGTSLGNFATSVGNAITGYQPSGALPQYSTGSWSNPTGFNTGVGGSGYSAASMGGADSQQAQMLASQW